MNIKERMAQRVRARLNSASPVSQPTSSPMTDIESAARQLNPLDDDKAISYLSHIRGYIDGVIGITLGMFNEALEWLSTESSENAEMAAKICLSDEEVIGKGHPKNSPINEEKALTFYKRAFFLAIEENCSQEGVDKILQSIWKLYRQNNAPCNLLNIMSEEAQSKDLFAMLWMGWLGIPTKLQEDIAASDCITCSDLYCKGTPLMPNILLENLLMKEAIPPELQAVAKDNTTQTINYLETVCHDMRQQEQYRIHESIRVFYNFIWENNYVLEPIANSYVWTASAEAIQIPYKMDEQRPSVLSAFDDAVNKTTETTPYWNKTGKGANKPTMAFDYDDNDPDLPPSKQYDM